jgi:hypothetical protein
MNVRRIRTHSKGATTGIFAYRSAWFRGVVVSAGLAFALLVPSTAAATSDATVLRAEADGSVIDLGSDGTPDFVYDGLGSVIVGFNAHFGPGEYRGVYEFDVRGFRTCPAGYSVRLRLTLAGTFADAGDPNLTLWAATGDGAVTIDDFGAGAAVTGFSPYASETYPFTFIDVSPVVESAVDAGNSHIAFIVRPNPASSSVQGAFLFSSNEISDAYGFTPTALETSCTTIDTTLPVLTVPSIVRVDATSPIGASVDYSSLVSATDSVDPAPVVRCTPRSGSTFAIGDTTVSCTARDASGNEATASFVVHVRGAPEQLTTLIDAVVATNAKQGIVSSLDAKLQAVQQALAAERVGDGADACSKLEAFIHGVEAQAGKALTADEAVDLGTAAARIRAVLGCA